MMNFLSNEEIADLLRVECPSLPSRSGWKFNLPEILALIKEMQIELPVQIKFSSGGVRRKAGSLTRDFRTGAHYVQNEKHYITVSHYADRDKANDILLHELRHAAQTEAWAKYNGEPVEAFYRKEYKLHGTSGEVYRNNPWEIDAEGFAEAMKDRMLVIMAAV